MEKHVSGNTALYDVRVKNNVAKIIKQVFIFFCAFFGVQRSCFRIACSWVGLGSRLVFIEHGRSGPMNRRS